MADDKFKGDQKAPMRAPLVKLERRFIAAWVDRIPSWLETYHLTLMTILWTIGVVAAGYLAQQDLRWLWLSSAMLALQWLTDAFDGAVGKHRDTGLVKWGYHMDHFLDYLFMTGLIVSYTFLLDGLAQTAMILLIPVFGGLWVNSFLVFSVTQEFQITRFFTGPTELRIYFILLNTALILWGTAFLQAAAPWALLAILIALSLIVYQDQRRIWALDMDAKRQRDANPDGPGSPDPPARDQ